MKPLISLAMLACLTVPAGAVAVTVAPPKVKIALPPYVAPSSLAGTHHLLAGPGVQCPATVVKECHGTPGTELYRINDLY